MTAGLGITVLARIPGKDRNPRPGGAELLRDFLLQTAGMDPEQAAAIAGVNPATIRRWRLGGTRNVRRDIRKRLLVYLAAQSLGLTPRPQP